MNKVINSHHHVYPIRMGGEHHDVGIIKLPDDQHVKLHQISDLSRTSLDVVLEPYHKELHNSLIMSEQAIILQYDLLQQFFARYDDYYNISIELPKLIYDQVFSIVNEHYLRYECYLSDDAKNYFFKQLYRHYHNHNLKYTKINISNLIALDKYILARVSHNLIKILEAYKFSRLHQVSSELDKVCLIPLMFRGKYSYQNFIDIGKIDRSGLNAIIEVHDGLFNSSGKKISFNGMVNEILSRHVMREYDISNLKRSARKSSNGSFILGEKERNGRRALQRRYLKDVEMDLQKLGLGQLRDQYEEQMKNQAFAEKHYYEQITGKTETLDAHNHSFDYYFNKTSQFVSQMGDELIDTLDIKAFSIKKPKALKQKSREKQLKDLYKKSDGDRLVLERLKQEAGLSKTQS